MVVAGMLTQRIVLHETFQITLLQDIGQHILKCHPVPVVVLVKQPQHDVRFLAAEQEVFRIAYLPQPTPLLVGIDFFLIIQIGHGILCPILVEDCLPQQTQVLGCHFVLPVYQVRLRQTLEATATLVEVRYGLHRLKSETLCRIDHTQ